MTKCMSLVWTTGLQCTKQTTTTGCFCKTHSKNPRFFDTNDRATYTNNYIAKSKLNTRQCQGLNKTGKQCSRQVKIGYYCHSHKVANQTVDQTERSKYMDNYNKYVLPTLNNQEEFCILLYTRLYNNITAFKLYVDSQVSDQMEVLLLKTSEEHNLTEASASVQKRGKDLVRLCKFLRANITNVEALDKTLLESNKTVKHTDKIIMPEVSIGNKLNVLMALIAELNESVNDKVTVKSIIASRL